MTLKCTGCAQSYKGRAEAHLNNACTELEHAIAALEGEGSLPSRFSAMRIYSMVCNLAAIQYNLAWELINSCQHWR